MAGRIAAWWVVVPHAMAVAAIAIPVRPEQEMWTLLALYQALRIAVTDAAQTVPGTDPDRASYHIAP